jgi:hypothetical protein
MIVALVALFFSLTGDPFAKVAGKSAPVTGFDIRTEASQTKQMPPDFEWHVTGNCPSGSAAISGGFVVLAGTTSIRQIASVPRNGSHSWEQDFYNPPAALGGAAGAVQAAVQCMSVIH